MTSSWFERWFIHWLGRDQALVTAALVVVTIAAWAYTWAGVGMPMSASDMTMMPLDMPMPLTVWSPLTSLVMFAMWWVMMVAMMLPSAAPMILLYTRVARKDRAPYGIARTAVFASGYLVIWGAFSLAATVLHAWGEQLGVLNGMMSSASDILSAGLLIAAGLYQLTSVKTRCLEACRAPVVFLARIWRPGIFGAFRMGIIHGAFCVGCCWALMLLLFVGGVMNLFWIGGLALLVLAERLSPRYGWLTPSVGVVCLGYGGWVLIQNVAA